MVVVPIYNKRTDGNVQEKLATSDERQPAKHYAVLRNGKSRVPSRS